MGPVLYGVRLRGEAVLALRTGRAVVPDRGLGGARRRSRRRPRQLRAPLPRHLGHRPRRRRTLEKKVRAAVAAGKVTFKFRYRVDELVTTGGAVTGVRGAILETGSAARGTAGCRTVVGDFEQRAPVVVVTSGGIGANHDLVRQNWPARLGTPPKSMVTGVPAHVDGRMLGITEQAGGRIVNPDRMWHYTEGLRNYAPIWPKHGIRILPGPSSMWFDAKGRRFNTPDIPGYDTLHTLGSITASGYDYSWFVTTQKILAKEFALSGSEQSPDLTNKNIRQLLSRIRQTPEPIEKFKNNGVDFVVADNLTDLVTGMNKLTGDGLIDLADLKRQIEARDREIDNPYTKDVQVMGIRNALDHVGDSLSRTASIHRILDTGAGPPHRRPAEHPHPQDPGRSPEGPLRTGPEQQRGAGTRSLRRR
ncbi:FAD-binding protein [Streptomyces sp. NPDC007901]|uniref:FAD-binding protein n=1 Tax=Streptomyces sp. NPDC007901 TaxID=3364785 RepID=UPI0036EBBA41